MSSILKKSQYNPLIKPSMVPFESTQTYNAGITKFKGKYVMLFRNDYNFTKADMQRLGGEAFKLQKINLGLAVSDDGIKWQIKSEPVLPVPLTGEMTKVYDPRLTVIDGRC